MTGHRTGLPAPPITIRNRTSDAQRPPDPRPHPPCACAKGAFHSKPPTPAEIARARAALEAREPAPHRIYGRNGPLAGLYGNAPLAELYAFEQMTVEANKNACERCGCTDADCSNCITATGRPCYWIRNRLCSACATPEELAAFQRPDGAAQDHHPRTTTRERTMDQQA